MPLPPAFSTLAETLRRPLTAHVLLALLALLWLIPGLVGHDPWKGDEGVTLGQVQSYLAEGFWRADIDAPLFTLSAAASVQLLSDRLPPHDAARLTTGLFMGLAVLFTGLTARALFGTRRGWPAALFLLGSLGMLVRGHELAPDAAGLATLALGLYALARCRDSAGWGILLGIALALGFFASAIPAALALPLTLVLLPAFATWRRALPGVVLAFAVAVPLVGAWVLALESHHAGLAARAWDAALGNLAPFAGTGSEYRPGYYLTLSLWFAFPAWPIAAWALWITRRRHPAWPGLLPAAIYLAVMLALLSLSVDPRETHALPLLPGFAILAAEGLFTLRRGAANAATWFGAMCFSLFNLLAWIYWSALELDTPARLARHLDKLQPGYPGSLDPLAVGLGILLTLAWVGLLTRLRRIPERPVVVWSAGLTLLWCLFILLFMRVIDDRLSYRALSGEIARETRGQCIAVRNLGDDHLAILRYHAHLDLRARDADCPWLLVRGKRNRFEDPGNGWQETWNGGRDGERRERFRMFRRMQPMPTA